jgi:hypothetical protein
VHIGSLTVIAGTQEKDTRIFNESRIFSVGQEQRLGHLKSCHDCFEGWADFWWNQAGSFKKRKMPQ